MKHQWLNESWRAHGLYEPGVARRGRKASQWQRSMDETCTGLPLVRSSSSSTRNPFSGTIDPRLLRRGKPWVSQQGLDRKTYRGSDVARCPLAQQLRKRRGTKPIPINKFVTSAVLTNRLDVQPSPHLIASNNWCRWEGTSYVPRRMCVDL